MVGRLVRPAGRVAVKRAALHLGLVWLALACLGWSYVSMVPPGLTWRAPVSPLLAMRVRRRCLEPGVPELDLVVVVHSGRTGHDAAAEWSNLGHFLRHGVDVSRADYVFVMPGDGSWPGHMVNQTGVTFVSTPGPVACDLCAHSHALERVVGLEGISERYGVVVMLNSGVRGPFVEDWLGRLRALSVGPERRTAVAVAFSWEPHCSAQSYFVAVPACVAGAVSELWRGACVEVGRSRARNVQLCSMVGEFPLLQYLNDLGVPVHSTSQGITISGDEGCREHEPALEWWELGHRNPNFGPVDLDRAMFIKYGGGVYRQQLIPRSVHRDVQMLPGR